MAPLNTATRQSARGKTFEPIDTPEELRRHLEWAIQVEFSTIPPYLTAMYSLQDPTSMAYRTIRSVVIEEMLHLNLACNLLNSIGGTPKLTGEAVPEFPGYIPHHAAGGPYLQLVVASPELMSTTFMAIEQPAPLQAIAQGEQFQTIGQFYEAIRQGFITCYRNDPGLFNSNTGIQPVDLYVGNGGGKAIAVTDLESAELAIEEIVEQGEGAEYPDVPLNPYEPFGNYDHYGKRVDGTFGPIQGSAYEMSHYFKFKQLADGDVPIGGTYPMAPNPHADHYNWDVARRLAGIFNGCYSAMLRVLENVFSVKGQTDQFFGAGFALMQSVLPSLAVQLMNTPVSESILTGDNYSLGPTAGPPFAWVDTSLETTIQEAKALQADVVDRQKSDDISRAEVNLLGQIDGTLSGVLSTLNEIHLG